MGCLLYCWWFGYSPFECEFYRNDVIHTVECSLSRVLSSIPQKNNPSTDDAFIYNLSKWILVQDLTQRPFTTNIIEKLQLYLLDYKNNNKTNELNELKNLNNNENNC